MEYRFFELNIFIAGAKDSRQRKVSRPHVCDLSCSHSSAVFRFAQRAGHGHLERGTQLDSLANLSTDCNQHSDLSHDYPALVDYCPRRGSWDLLLAIGAGPHSGVRNQLFHPGTTDWRGTIAGPLSATQIRH